MPDGAGCHLDILEGIMDPVGQGVKLRAWCIAAPVPIPPSSLLLTGFFHFY